MTPARHDAKPQDERHTSGNGMTTETPAADRRPVTLAQAADKPLTRWGLLAAAAGFAVAISGGVGILPTNRLAGRDGVIALGAAGAAVWFACAAGAVPAVLWKRSDPRDVLVAMQLGMAVRFVLTLAVATALALGTTLPRTPLLLWAGIHYMVALAVTMGVELWLTHRGRSGASE